MRGMVPGLDTAVPLLLQLPGILQDDDFTPRFVSAFDDGLAPVLGTLDSLAAYVDPWLAPPDFLDWLAGWVSVPLDDSWALEQKRAIVAGAATTHRRRGTLRGMVDALELALALPVEVAESGGCGWSATPGADLPGTADGVITVRIHATDPDRVDSARVEALVEELKPAHVAHRCVVVRVDEQDADPVLVAPRAPGENGDGAAVEPAPLLVGRATEEATDGEQDGVPDVPVAPDPVGEGAPDVVRDGSGGRDGDPAAEPDDHPVGAEEVVTDDVVAGPDAGTGDGAPDVSAQNRPEEES